MFNENILDVLKPLDLTIDMDNLMDMLTGDIKNDEAADFVQDLFDSYIQKTFA
jgi:primase-polymerase (primpol)-like protein